MFYRVIIFFEFRVKKANNDELVHIGNKIK